MLGVAQTKSTATIIKTIFVQTQRMQNGPKKTVQTIANCAVSCTKTFLLKKVFRKECMFKIDHCIKTYSFYDTTSQDGDWDVLNCLYQSIWLENHHITC